jgi:hypothetical protein
MCYHCLYQSSCCVLTLDTKMQMKVAQLQYITVCTTGSEVRAHETMEYRLCTLPLILCYVCMYVCVFMNV